MTHIVKGARMTDLPPPDPDHRQYSPSGACLTCDGYLDGSEELVCVCIHPEEPR
jgi:hypothetical protein